MKKISIYTLLFITSTVFLTLQAFSQWPARYNDPSSKNDNARLICMDEYNNVYITGVANTNYTTIKYTPDGKQLWIAIYNGPGNGDDNPTAIAYKSGAVYITGSSSGNGTNLDFATIKYDANTGKQLWVARTDQANFEVAHDVQVDASENVYVTGFSDGANQFNGNYITTIEYDGTSGSQLQRDDYSGLPNLYDGSATNKEEGNSLAFDAAGNLYIGGTSGGVLLLKYQSSLLTASARTVINISSTGNTKKILPDNLGHLFILSDAGNLNTYRFDISTNTIIPSQLGGSSIGLDMVLDPSGNPYVFGSLAISTGGSTITVVKYNNDLTVNWSTSYAGNITMKKMALDPVGDIYITGGITLANGSKNGNSNYLTLEYDPTGLLINSFNYDSGFGTDYAAAIVSGPNGYVYVTGSSQAPKALQYDYLTTAYKTFTPAITLRNVSSVNDHQVKTSSFRINSFPNPTNNQFTLECNVVQSSQIINVRILDATGRLIEAKQISAVESWQFGSSYTPGVYYVEAVQGNKKEIVKLVKQSY